MNRYSGTSFRLGTASAKFPESSLTDDGEQSSPGTDD